MMSPDFTAFLLARLQREGLTFSLVDFALFERGARSWHQLINTKMLNFVERVELTFIEASSLSVLGVERFPDGTVKAPARVQARFLDRGGDVYVAVWEKTLEELITEFYAGQVWAVEALEAQEVGLPYAH